MNCFNCGTPYQVIERNVQGLAIGYRCPRCEDEFWPHEQFLPPEVQMAIDLPADDDPDNYREWDGHVPECPHCHGTGGDPWEDYISPCPKCDGEGYLWWL